MVQLRGRNRCGVGKKQSGVVQLTGKTDMVQLVGGDRRGAANKKERTWCSQR